MLIVSFVTFALARFGPGDPVEILMGQHTNPEVVQRIREQQGLDDPLALQYARYIGNAFKGDFGESFQFRGRSVSELLIKKLPVTIQLNLAALIISVGVGIPAGVFAAMRQGTGWGQRRPDG